MMKKTQYALAMASIIAISHQSFGMEGTDDPLLTMVSLDEFERRLGNGDDKNVVKALAWVGKDINKVFFKYRTEFTDDETESSEIQALYSRAITANWDLQAGFRQDFTPNPDEQWIALGLYGVSPYFFEVDSSIFIADEGQIGLRLEAEYEAMLTQKWVLSPEIEVNFYAEEDQERGYGDGLSNIELGLRLRYEVNRQFAPYIGINWEKQIGDAADFARNEGENSSETSFVIGLNTWF